MKEVRELSTRDKTLETKNFSLLNLIQSGSKAEHGNYSEYSLKLINLVRISSSGESALKSPNVVHAFVVTVEGRKRFGSWVPLNHRFLS
jgi:hypothetical protein